MKPLSKKVINEMDFIYAPLNTPKTTNPQRAGVYKAGDYCDPKQLRKDMVRILHEKQAIRDSGGAYTNDYSGPGPGVLHEKCDKEKKPTQKKTWYEFLFGSKRPGLEERKSAEMAEYHELNIPEHKDIRGTSLWRQYEYCLTTIRGGGNSLKAHCDGYHDFHSRHKHLQHIISIKNGGSNRPQNLEIVCIYCRNREHLPWALEKTTNKSLNIVPWDEKIPVVDIVPTVIPTFEYGDIQIPEYEDIRGTWLWFKYKGRIIMSRGAKCNQFDPNYCPTCELELHHIIEMKNGGSNRPENLELLCQIHHAKKHPHVMNAWKRGYRRRY